MKVTLNQHIEITSGVRGGKPRIAGTRMTVADIATLYLREVGLSIYKLRSGIVFMLGLFGCDRLRRRMKIRGKLSDCTEKII